MDPDQSGGRFSCKALQAGPSNGGDRGPDQRILKISADKTLGSWGHGKIFSQHNSFTGRSRGAQQDWVSAQSWGPLTCLSEDLFNPFSKSLQKVMIFLTWHFGALCFVVWMILISVWTMRSVWRSVESLFLTFLLSLWKSYKASR